MGKENRARIVEWVQSQTMEDELMLLAQAAAEVGVSPERLRQLIKEDRLKAEKLGTYWVVRRSEVRRFKKQPRLRTGRPRKPPTP
jgi:excisionase family DNA binding protein